MINYTIERVYLEEKGENILYQDICVGEVVRNNQA